MVLKANSDFHKFEANDETHLHLKIYILLHRQLREIQYEQLSINSD